jgi:hypothetical protein
MKILNKTIPLNIVIFILAGILVGSAIVFAATSISPNKYAVPQKGAILHQHSTKKS